MAIVLLQDPADPGDVLNGKLEHDQFHRCLAHLVILLQVALHNRGQLLEVSDFIIHTWISPRDKVVTKEQSSDIIIFEASSRRERFEQFINTSLELLLACILDNFKELHSVCIIDQSVIEHPVDLMNPQSYQLVPLLHVGLGHKQHPAHHTGEISQVEHVVRL